MTTAEVAEYLRFTLTSKTPLVSAWKWITKNQLRVYKVGRSVRVLRSAVDGVLRDEALERGGPGVKARRLVRKAGQDR